MIGWVSLSFLLRSFVPPFFFSFSFFGRPRHHCIDWLSIPIFPSSFVRCCCSFRRSSFPFLSLDAPVTIALSPSSTPSTPSTTSPCNRGVWYPSWLRWTKGVKAGDIVHVCFCLVQQRHHCNCLLLIWWHRSNGGHEEPKEIMNCFVEESIFCQFEQTTVNSQ